MEPQVGTRLGPYELLSPLGAGGMGQVYRARDTRLGRDVALKIADPGQLSDPVRRSRFEREMTITAKLTHPRICAVHDVGIEAGRPYFTMELLRGETLATRIDRAGSHGLPIAEAIDIAIGIADALAFAHRHGIVHGDVKPANVMLTPDGVKLLDFGVAKLRASDAAALSSAETHPVPVGTPAYMAPEQLDGRRDAQTDLFALGAVLYEMLAGRRAFPGDTSSDILGAVLSCSPQPLEEIRSDLPPAIGRLVQRCLCKDADDRWQSAADLGEALRWVRNPAALPVARSRQRSRIGWIQAALLVSGVFAVGAAVWFHGRSSANEAVAEFYLDDIQLPEGERFLSGQAAWTRDGRRVALVTQPIAGSALDQKLWTLEIGSSESWQLIDGAGPESVTYPSWSPDGRTLAYFRDHKLVRASLPSSAPVALADAREGRGATWLDDETVLYAPENQGDIWRVPANGGRPVVVVRRQAGDLGVKFPSAVGSGEFLYWAQRASQEGSEIRVASIQVPDVSRTVVQSSKAGALADGRLFFVQDNLLVAQPIEVNSWTFRGPAEPLPVEIGLGGNLGAPLLTTGGAVAGVQSMRREARELVWVDRTGRALGSVGAIDTYRTMALSPDGEQLLVESAAPGVDMAAISLLDLQNGASRRIATEVGAQLPVWHRDQGRVAFRASTGPGGSGAVHEHGVDDRASRVAVEVLASARPAGWMPNGDLVWWAGDVSGTYNGLFVRGANQVDRPYRLIPQGADIVRVAMRPDGRALAYALNASGVFEIYADTLPASRRAPWRVTTSGGTLPRWSRDGRELFFESGGWLHAIGMTGPGGAPAGVARRLFAFEGSDYDVHPDGRLLVQRRRRAEAHYLRVFRNWSARTAGQSTHGQ